ncbi:MAG: hypothetical protein ACREVV_14280, partial [Steroidobacteraceae bacterium]
DGTVEYPSEKNTSGVELRHPSAHQNPEINVKLFLREPLAAGGLGIAARIHLLNHRHRAIGIESPKR